MLVQLITKGFFFGALIISIAAHAGGSAVVEAPKNPVDPWESFNRRVFRFNDILDHSFIKPVAQTYLRIVPDRVERSISRFFNNLGETTTFASQLLQAKWIPAGQTGGRFIVNSTVGVLGFFDVATRIGLPAYDEDFGQALGYWGISSGPYIVLPILGPSTVRDAFGLIPQYTVTDPISKTDRKLVIEALYTLNLVQSRALLLATDDLAKGDKYIFARDVYLQRRNFLVNDGQVDDIFLNESW